MPKFDRYMIVLAPVGLIAFMFWLGHSWDVRVAEERAACAAKGGELLSTRNGDVCIAKGTIIR